MVEKEPGWLEKVVGTLFNPGGHPDDIRRAAAVCRQLSTNLAQGVASVEPAAAQLSRSWKGPSADAFQRAWGQYDAKLSEYWVHLSSVANTLEELADFIAETQRQAKIFWLMIAATIATGIAFTFITAGFSNAASAAVASAQLSGLAALAARMAFVISGQAAAVAAIQAAIATVAARLAMGMAFSFASSLIVKGVVQDLNVLDPDSWNANDGSKILLDGVLVIGMGSLASTPAVATRLAGPTGVASLGRQLTGGAIFGAGGSTFFSFVSQFGFGGHSLTDLEAWKEVGASMGVGGVAGFGSAGLFFGAPRVFQYTLRNRTGSAPVVVVRAPRLVDVGVSDVMRASTGMVSDAINYIINYPQPAVPPNMASGDPNAIPPQGVPVPIPATPTREPAPMLGGGTHTVRGGESLSTIARRVYGDANLWPRIAAANPQIANPSSIRPGQVIQLPVLQRVSP